MKLLFGNGYIRKSITSVNGKPAEVVAGQLTKWAIFLYWAVSKVWMIIGITGGAHSE